MNDLIDFQNDHSQIGFLEESPEHSDDMGGRLEQVEKMLGGGEQKVPVPNALEEGAKQFVDEAEHLQALREQVTELSSQPDIPKQLDSPVEMSVHKRSWREVIKGFFSGLKNAFSGGRRHRQFDSTDLGEDETGAPIGLLAAKREMSREAQAAEESMPTENAA